MILKYICLWLLVAANLSYSAVKRKIQVDYPVKRLVPSTGSHFSSNVSSSKLTCFGNLDYYEPSYRQTIVCMFPLPTSILRYVRCESIWGSRSVIVDIHGSVEFLKVQKLPDESNIVNKRVSISAERWLETQSLGEKDKQKRDIKYIPAEPFYLCARSNDWMGRDSYLEMEFRPAFLRESDRSLCLTKMVIHIALVVIVSSAWLMPYIASLVMCVIAYAVGLNKLMISLGLSCVVVSLTPLMLTKKNRHLAKLYFKYFFERNKAREARMVIRERLPVFQAIFFSSAVMCIGSASGCIIYSYFGVDREVRNATIKITMAIAASWFVFFLCRSFERFFRQWSWMGMAVALVQLLDSHLNPMCKDEAVVAVIALTLLTNKYIVPRVNLNSRFGPGFEFPVVSASPSMHSPRSVFIMNHQLVDDDSSSTASPIRNKQSRGDRSLGERESGYDTDTYDSFDEAETSGTDYTKELDEQRLAKDAATFRNEQSTGRGKVFKMRTPPCRAESPNKQLFPVSKSVTTPIIVNINVTVDMSAAHRSEEPNPKGFTDSVRAQVEEAVRASVDNALSPVE